MQKCFSRKDFIKIGTILGTGLLLDSCNLSENNTEEKSSKTKRFTLSKPPPPETESYSFDLITTEDLRYNGLRKGFNKSIDKYPAAIALCTTTKDVAEAISYAMKNNLAIAIKSGGHNVEGFSVNDGGMVINLSKMNSVEFLADNKLKIGPGCTIAQLYAEILPKNRIIPVGSCGSVAMGGLTMGGGYGLFSREYGLICDQLLEATFVDGNGTIHSTKDDPELLWALRGGGSGNFGVVTEMIFQSHKAPAGIQAHYFKALNLNAERAKHILERWFEFTSLLPNSCFSGFVLNGKTLNIIVMNHERKTSAFQNLLNTLGKEMDQSYPGKYRELSVMMKNYYGLPTPANFKISSAGFYKSYEDISECILPVLDKVIHTKGMIYQVNTFGGNINNPAFEKGSCFPHRTMNYISELQSYWEVTAQEQKLKAATSEILETFKNNGITAQYVNYCNADFEQWETAYYGTNYQRLQAIKRKYDLNNIIRHPQSIKV